MWINKTFSLLLSSLLLLTLVSCQPSPEEQAEINTKLVDYGCEEVQDFTEYNCNKTFVAKSLADLQNYYVDYGNSNSNKAKNLKIDFSFTGDSTTIKSPCHIYFDKNVQIETTNGSLCVLSRKGIETKTTSFKSSSNVVFASLSKNIVLRKGTSIEGTNFYSETEKKLLVNLDTSIQVSGDIELSTRDLEKGRVKFGRNVDISASNLTITSNDVWARKNTNLTIANDLNITGVGIDPVLKLSKNVNIIADNFNSENFSDTTIKNNTSITATTVSLSGDTCAIDNGASINSSFINGDCFPNVEIIADLDLPNGNVDTGLEITLDASNSQGLAAVAIYRWNILGVEKSTLGPILNHTFYNSGSFPITLTLVAHDGREISDSKTITVVGDTPNEIPPTARLSVINDNINSPLNITVDASTSSDPDSTIVNYLFDFGDGNTTSSTTPIANHVYQVGGLYEVKVTVTDSQNLADFNSSSLRINSPPSAQFDISDPLASAPAVIDFDGSNSEDVGGMISSYIWLINDLEVQTVVPFLSYDFPLPGLYSISLKVIDNEGASSTSAPQVLRVNGAPFARFTPSPYTGRYPLTVNFDSSTSTDDSESVLSFEWDFGTGVSSSESSPSYTFENPGQYDVNLTVTDDLGLFSKSSIQITVKGDNDAPIASFTNSQDRGNPPVVISFDAAGSSDDNSISSYSWNFGDGTTVTNRLSAIDHIFNGVGAFNVSLIVTDDEGVSSTTFQKTIFINTPPIANLNLIPESGNPGTVVSIDPSLSSDDISISQISIDFGDGSSVTQSTTQAVNHTYNNPGTYEVTSIVTDNEGATHSVTKIVSINAPPTSQITASTIQGDFPLSVNFFGGSSSDDKGIVNYSYKFAGLGSSSGANPNSSFVFSDPGSFLVELTVTDTDGLENTSSQLIVVNSNPLPVADFSFESDSFIAPSTVSFDGSLSSDNRDIASYEFNFGDGYLSHSKVQSFTFDQPGVYPVLLRVIDDQGGISIVSKDVTINSNLAPVADFSFDPQGGQFPIGIKFDAGISLDDEEIISYAWKIDGVLLSSTDKIMDYVFTSSKVYTVELDVMDRQGEFHSVSKLVNITDPTIPSDLDAPVISFLNIDPVILDSTSSISFLVTDDSAIDYERLRIEMNGQSVDPSKVSIDLLLNKVDIIFDQDLNLLVNQYNTFFVYIGDEYGNISTSAISYDVRNSIDGDIEGPKIIFETGEGNLASVDYSLNIDIFDDSSINNSSLSLKLNNQTIPSAQYSLSQDGSSLTITFNSSFPLSDNSMNTVEVSIEDSLSNTGIASIGLLVIDEQIVQSGEDVLALGGGGGDVHCAVLEDNTLRCFGYGNVLGTLGYGNQITNVGASDNNPLSLMGPVPVGFPVKQVSVRGSAVCALSTLGEVKCWGQNPFGIVGQGHTNNIGHDEPASATPSLPFGEPAIKVVSGATHACALFNAGKIRCWGYNLNGQLGYGHTNNIGDDETLVGLDYVDVGGYVKDIKVSHQHTCALLDTNDLKCWGFNDRNVLGNFDLGTKVGDDELPSSIPPINFGAKVTEFTIDTALGCAVLDNGETKCWGINVDGILGLGFSSLFEPNNTDKYPINIPSVPLLSTPKVVRSSFGSTCVVFEDGGLKCWGQQFAYKFGMLRNDFLGDDESINSYGNVDVGAPVKDVQIGFYNVCATLESDELKCWGPNAGRIGQLPSSVLIGDDETPSSIGPIDFGGLKLLSGSSTTLAASFSATPSSGPVPLSVDLDASQSETTGAAISEYRWSFDDGSPDQLGITTNHIFNELGPKLITLTVTDGDSNTASTQRVINAFAGYAPISILSVNETSGSVPLTVNFDASSSIDFDGTITSYDYIIDGVSNISASPNFTHIFTTGGTHEVVLRVTDNNLNTADSEPIILFAAPLNESPIADFDCSVNNQTVSCDATKSVDFDGVLGEFEWDFGNGDKRFGEQVSYTYDTPNNGVYSVTLKVFDDHVESGEIQKVINLDSTDPVINISSNQLLVNNSHYSFDLNISDTSIVTFQTFVNGSLSQSGIGGSNTVVVNLNEGMNNIEVIATDNVGNGSTSGFLVNLDTEAPTLLSLASPVEGEDITSFVYSLKGQASEDLASLTYDGVEITLDQNNRNFDVLISGTEEGSIQKELLLTDLAGNQTSISKNYFVDVPVFNTALITTSPVNDSSNVLITGLAGASRLNNHEFTASSGFFNSESLSSNADGSFEVELSYFNLAALKTFNPGTGRDSVSEISYQADTTLSGVVLDTNDNPIVGAKVTIKSSGQIGYTDGTGSFSISNPTTGDQEIEIDASVATLAANQQDREFSQVTILRNIGPFQRNILSNTIYLAPLMKDGTETVIDSNAGATVSVVSSHAPGVEIIVPTDKVVFPNSSSVGEINLAIVDKSKTSVPVPMFAEPDTVVALEPSGLKFTEPVQLTLPNENEFPEGMQLVIMSKDSSKGTWVIDGLARVDAGGDSITTEEGAGITHFSEVFAAPMGLSISEIGSKDKPGADTFNGAVSTSIQLPSYKSFGTDISPSLVYNSNWAKPTAVISNLFDIPRNELSISDALAQGGRALTKEEIDNQGGNGFIYLAPDYVDVQFISDSIVSEKMRFTGLPQKSVVSYAMDLSNFDSGITPYVSTYEMHFKQLVVRPWEYYHHLHQGNYNVSMHAYLSRRPSNIPGYRVESESQVQKAFPSEIAGPLFVQNKIHSAAGKGWKISGEQRIYSTDSPRMMVEEADGSIASYTINNTIDSLVVSDDEIQGVDLSEPDFIRFTNKKGEIKHIDLSLENPSTELEDRLDPFTGSFGSIYSVCGAGGDKTQCSQRENCFRESFNFTLSRDIQHLLTVGNDYLAIGAEGLLYKTNQSSVEVLAGTTKVPQRFFQINDSPAPGRESIEAINFCESNDLLECSGATQKDTVLEYIGPPEYGSGTAIFGVTAIGTLPSPYYWMRRGFCGLWSTAGRPHEPFPFRESTGIYPDSGFSEGDVGTSKMNNPKHFILGVSNNVLIADSGNNRIRSLDLNTNTMSTFVGNGQNFDSGDDGDATDASLFHPKALARDEDGNLYIATENGFIRKVNSQGKISTYGGRRMDDTSPGAIFDDVGHITNMRLSDPQGLVVDNENNILYISDTGNHRVLSVDMTTKVATVIAGSGCSQGAPTVGDGGPALDSSLCSPTTLGLDENKNLLIFDKGNKRVRKVTFSSSEGGILAYVPASKDNSLIKKLADNSFERTYRNGTVAKFDVDGKQVNLEARNGRTVEYFYDTEGNLISQKDPSGSEIRYQYSGGKLNSILDPAGRETFFNYNGDLLESVDLPDGSSRSFVYDADGRMTSELDQRLNPTNYTYNNFGRLTEVERADGSTVKLDDSTSKSIGNTYTNGAEGAFTSYGKEAGELYDGIKDGKNQETKFVKDVNGYVSTIVDALGRETLVERNLKGLPTKITRSDLTEANFTYDPISNDLLSKSDTATGVSLEYTYNEFGQPLSRELPGDRYEVRTYDPASGDLLTVTNPLSQTDTIEYHPLSLVKKRTNHEGQTTEFTYDAFGNLSISKDSLGFETRFVRDFSGNVTKVINSKGQETINTYDSFNRLISVTTPKNETTSYEYLATGELSKITDPQNNVTLFEYDALGRLVKKTDPLGKITQLSYDANGNVEQEIDPNGNIKTFVYDPIDQLVERHLPDNDYFISYDVRGNVTQVKNLHSQIDYQYERLEVGEVVSAVNSKGLGVHADLPDFEVGYDYDSSGNRTDMITPLGNTQYTYDGGDRLRELENHKGEIFNFNYDDANRLREIIRPGSRSILNFDDSNFLTQIVHSKVSDSTLIEEFNYGRDAIGNRVSITSTRGIASYGYDDNNQLVSATTPDVGSESFVYDSLGNRVTDSNGNYVYDTYKQRLTEDFKYFYFYDDNGNLSSKNAKASTDVIQYVHNSENQLVGIDYYDGTTKTKEITYTYDAIGRRVKKVVNDIATPANSKTRKFVYDSNEVLAQMDESNQVLSIYTHSTLRTDDTLSVDITVDGVSKGLAQTAQSYFYGKDAQGTVIDILDSAGSIVQHYAYSSFGELIKILDPSNEDISGVEKLAPYFTYTNREFDEESGLYYYRARMYDANVGRFLSVDPHPGSSSSPITHLSKYIYTANNPIRLLDPSGEKFKIGKVFQAVAAISISVGLIAVGTLTANPTLLGAGIGGFVGTVYAIYSGESIFDNFAKGLIAGALIGAVYATAGVAVGNLALGTSILSAGIRRGNVLDNYLSAGLSSGGGNLLLAAVDNPYLSYLGGAAGIYSFGKTLCDEEEATDFANSFCINEPGDLIISD
ncbi:MAG: hypothetical protein CME70_23915 [Halobacteriovorax sp.]|nr:hypothetical protein [Halobacteriovorax sp.]|tara:strand:- start:35269 stop:48102 length:12834 start_codon:yes stop_codon:yes gene_type:complete